MRVRGRADVPHPHDMVVWSGAIPPNPPLHLEGEAHSVTVTTVVHGILSGIPNGRARE